MYNPLPDEISRWLYRVPGRARKVRVSQLSDYFVVHLVEITGQAVQVDIGAPDSSGATVRAESEYGRSEVHIEADKIEAGQAYDEGAVEPFGISSRYLRDALASVASFGDRINIALGVSPIDPVTIISECGENLAVVMPMRI